MASVMKAQEKGWIDRIAEGVAGAVPDAVGAFRKRVQKWYEDFDRLVKSPIPLDPDLRDRRASLIKKGNLLVSAIKKLGVDFKPEELGLVFIPVLAGAAVVAVLSGITYWYYDYRKYTKGLEVAERLAESGHSPEDIKTIFTASDNPSGGFKLDTKLIMGAVMLGGLYIWLKNKGG